MLLESWGCQLGQDEDWNITWLPTDSGGIAMQKCPGSSDAYGIVTIL